MVEHDAAAVDEVVRSAALQAVPLADQPDEERADMLDSIAAAIEARGQELVEVAHAESHLDRNRLEGEVGRTAGQFRLFAGVVRDGGFHDVRVDPDDSSGSALISAKVPLGAVGVFGASNFPLAFSVPGGDTASALAAGCPVVAKVHPAHPETSRIAAEAVRSGLAAADVAPDALGLVSGLEAGVTLVEHPLIRAVGFTGSEAAGRLLFDLACARPDPIPFYGELGSINPVVLLPSGDPAAFGAGLAASVALGAGQFCTKPGLVLVPERVAGHVVATVTDALDRQGGFRMLTTGIAQAFERKVSELDEYDLWRHGEPGEGRTGSAIVRVGAGEILGDRRLVEERFGPVTVIVGYTDYQQVLEVLQNVPPSLAAAVHGEPGAEADAIVSALSATVGRLVWNDFTTGVRVGQATHHGGLYPASTSPLHTSVGARAIERWLRPVAYQGFPYELLPPGLRQHVEQHGSRAS